jgi:hypothetical protein
LHPAEEQKGQFSKQNSGKAAPKLGRSVNETFFGILHKQAIFANFRDIIYFNNWSLLTFVIVL